MTAPTRRQRGQGFASMSPEERSRIASLGGKAAHAAGTAHKFTSEEARAAGQKGGRLGHTGKGPQKPKQEDARAALRAYFMSTED